MPSAVCIQKSEKSRMRILIADSEPLFLRGVRAALGEHVEIVAEAFTASQLDQELRRHNPDILLMGFRLACGRNALGLASETRGAPAVVFLSPTSAILASQLLSAGLRAVLSRAAQLETIFPAIENVLSGGIFVDPDLLPPRQQAAFKASRVNSLSARELEVFQLLGEDKSPSDIASLLGLSVKTISNHKESIKSKLDFGSTTAVGLIAKAYTLWESSGVDYMI